MGKLVYFKWMVEDAKVLKENLTTEQIGELFVAVMDYLQTGTVVEVSKEIRFPYADYRNKVDRASASYEETCAKRAESGKKGGAAKAKNAVKVEGAAPAQTKKFKPPTLTQFKNAVDRAIENNEWDPVEDYDIESFYDHLNDNGWEFEGMAIQSRKDWEQIVHERFDTNYGDYPVGCFDVFRHLMKNYPELHHHWDCIGDITIDLFDGWNDKRETWIIGEQTYSRYGWREALDVLAAKCVEKLPP